MSDVLVIIIIGSGNGLSPVRQQGIVAWTCKFWTPAHPHPPKYSFREIWVNIFGAKLLHCTSHCWFIVNWTYGNKFQSNLYQNISMFMPVFVPQASEVEMMWMGRRTRIPSSARTRRKPLNPSTIRTTSKQTPTPTLKKVAHHSYFHCYH